MATQQIRITITPDVPGGYGPRTFVHLLQHRIHLAGLDRHYHHTLIGYTVADDGDSAELVVHSEPIAAHSLTHGLAVVTGTPNARIRAFTPEGECITEAMHHAPLQAGQQVRIGDVEYAVDRVEWPGRDSKSGVCHGEVDWQHAHLTPIEAPVSGPVKATL